MEISKISFYTRKNWVAKYRGNKKENSYSITNFGTNLQAKCRFEQDRRLPHGNIDFKDPYSPVSLAHTHKYYSKLFSSLIVEGVIVSYHNYCDATCLHTDGWNIPGWKIEMD